jgi:hypothetical protein
LHGSHWQASQQLHFAPAATSTIGKGGSSLTSAANVAEQQATISKAMKLLISASEFLDQKHGQSTANTFDVHAIGRLPVSSRGLGSTRLKFTSTISSVTATEFALGHPSGGNTNTSFDCFSGGSDWIASNNSRKVIVSATSLGMAVGVNLRGGIQSRTENPGILDRIWPINSMTGECIRC